VRLLLDEMYSPAIAEGLRARGRDAVSVHDRADLAAASDAAILATAQGERRALVTNNVRDFAPLVHDAHQQRAEFFGIVFTSDRSLPRSRATIGRFVELLDALLVELPADDGLAGLVHWLGPGSGGS